MAVYIFIWLILHIVARNDLYGSQWLIYITDLIYLLLTIATMAMTGLTIWYTIVYYTRPSMLLPYFPTLKGTPQEIYSQDNIPWFAKICWALYIVAGSMTPLVVAGYWVLVYRPCPSMTQGAMNTTMSSEMTMATMSAETTMAFDSTMGTESPSTQGLGSIGNCTELDAYSLHFHGINFFLLLADVCLSRIPFQFMHFFYPLFFMGPYVIFTVIYWGAGGLNPINEMNYVYGTLDYSDGAVPAVLAVLLIFSPIPVYWVVFLVIWLRDFISSHISCCYRDLTSSPKDSEDIVENGLEREPESTIL